MVISVQLLDCKSLSHRLNVLIKATTEPSTHTHTGVKTPALLFRQTWTSPGPSGHDRGQGSSFAEINGALWDFKHIGDCVCKQEYKRARIRIWSRFPMWGSSMKSVQMLNVHVVDLYEHRVIFFTKTALNIKMTDFR